VVGWNDDWKKEARNEEEGREEVACGGRLERMT